MTLIWIYITLLLCVTSTAISPELAQANQQHQGHIGVQDFSHEFRIDGRSLSDDASGSSAPAVFKSFKFHDIDIHYQELVPEGEEPPAMVFLHGASFTSDTWASLGTLELARKAGYHVVALDLPGHGKTRRLPYSDNNMRAELLRSVVNIAQPKVNHTTVLLSPSMSGRYAIPFLDRYGTMLHGWVAIAPVGVDEWGGPWEDTHKKVSLLAMYGASDKMLPDSTKLSKMFAKAVQEVLPAAGHACYLNQTVMFHSKLAAYLQRIRFEKHTSRRRSLLADLVSEEL